ncbi:MAG: hypothetical protein ACJAU0_002196 [Flavobacteriales bacterium]|jgi:hypothetical protein
MKARVLPLALKTETKMKTIITFLFTLLFVQSSNAGTSEPKTVHVFVALCDNVNQGIVPVPEKIGNGQDPANNLYWGCGYGIKSFFKLKTTEWIFQKMVPSTNDIVLERALFKHKTENCFMLAEAYDGKFIKACTEDFLRASNRQNEMVVDADGTQLKFGGRSDLIAYIGHDGLMDFDVDLTYEAVEETPPEIIILACYSKKFFAPEILSSQAKPLLWTTHLMAPEAYTLKAALDGWLLGESGAEIDERAAQAYHQYQKCGISGARNLFTTGH